MPSNTRSFAELEFDILSKSNTDPNNRPIIEEFRDEILALVDKFGNSGQSGGSAPYTASAISSAVKKLCLQQPICPITGIDEEWSDVSERYPGETLYQNKRCYALFKGGKDDPAYYLDAIVWYGDTVGESGITGWDTFTGTLGGISSRQYVKSFPFTPKTFYIDVTRVPYDPDIHSKSDAVSCGPGDFVYLIKDKSQLDKVWEYYDQYTPTKGTITSSSDDTVSESPTSHENIPES